MRFVDEVGQRLVSQNLADGRRPAARRRARPRLRIRVEGRGHAQGQRRRRLVFDRQVGQHRRISGWSISALAEGRAVRGVVRRP